VVRPEEVLIRFIIEYLINQLNNIIEKLNNIPVFCDIMKNYFFILNIENIETSKKINIINMININYFSNP
jgi:hypothetical protein